MSINKNRINLVSKEFRNGMIVGAVKDKNQMSLHFFRNDRFNKIMKVDLLNEKIYVLADTLIKYENILYKNKGTVYLNGVNNGLAIYRNEHIYTANINCDKGYSVSPDNRYVAYSNFVNFESLFCYDLKTRTNDTLYCVKYSDFETFDFEKGYYVGATTSFQWIDKKTICYGSGDNGLMKLNINTKKVENIYPKIRFIYNIAKKNDWLLLISEKDTSKNELYLANIKKREIIKILSEKIEIIDTHWIDANKFIYMYIKDGVKYLSVYYIKSGKNIEIISTRNLTEQICIIK